MSAPEKIWSRFTRIQNGKELKLRIQDLTVKDAEDILSFWFKYYVSEEPIHKATKIAQSAQALKEYKEAFTMKASDASFQINACCLDGDSDDRTIVGVSIMILQKKDEPSEDFEELRSMAKSVEIKTLIDISDAMDKKYDIFKELNFDACYKGGGVAVHKDYRGLGIAGEILKARSLVCKAQGVPMTSAWMSSYGTQKAAARLGWKTVYEFQFKEFREEVGVEFDLEPPSCKLMMVTI